MNKIEKFMKGPIFPYFGILGTIIISLGCLISGIAFRGPSGQLYSMGNYFISELGGVVESELAIVFNIGIIIGGILLVVFMGGLFYQFTAKIAKFGSILGVIAGIMGVLVGFFPFDVNIAVHGLVAMGFFYGGMITVILLTIGLFLEKAIKYPKILGILGIISGLIFIIFNFTLGDFAVIFSEPINPVDFSIDDFRPTFWLLALFEWLSLLGMLLWMCAMALFLTKTTKPMQYKS